MFCSLQSALLQISEFSRVNCGQSSTLLLKLSLKYGQDSDKQELLVNMSVRHLHREQGQLGHGRGTAFGAKSISTVTMKRGTQQCLELS
jgi:hypothetical protein